MFLSTLHIALVAFAGLAKLCSAQNATDNTAKFGQTLSVPGAMERFDQDFEDGLALDLFSPKNRSIVVTQNMKPLGGQFVTGSNGERFIALQNYSYVIKMNETANDLIAKIEVPYDLAMLGRMGIQEANTYVGTLADDKMSWVVDDATRNVHRSENVTRIIKMTSIDGEFMLLGRQNVDVANIFVQYGQGETRTVNITGGGRQEAEFIDGLRFSVVSKKDLRMNVDIRNGVTKESLPAGVQSLNTFSWVVNTSDPSANLTASMKVPFNRNILTAMRPAGSSPSTMLTVAMRPLNSAPTTQFAIVQKQVVNELPEDRLTVRDLQRVDGEYVIFVTPPKSVGSSPTTTREAQGYRRRRRTRVGDRRPAL